MKYFNFFLLFCLWLSANNLVAQNGWTQKKGGLYAQSSISFFNSNKYYSVEGELFEEGATFRQKNFSLYGEYGLNDRFTALFFAPVLVLNSFSTTETVGGIGDIQVGLKYGLLKEIPLSIAFQAEIPTNDGITLARAKEPNDFGLIEEINLPTSDGEFNFWTTLALSQSTENGKTFGSLFGSFNLRTQNFSNQWKAGVELGQLIGENLYIIGKAHVLGRFSDELNTSASFLYGEGTTYTAFDLTVMYSIAENWTVVASYANFSGIVVKKRNAYDGGTFTIGLAFSR